MTAQEKLLKQIKDQKHICVGLDTDIEKIPSHLHSFENPVLEFNKRIIENTYKHAAAYKLNFAFYEKEGSKGMETLKRTIEIIPSEILIIGDAKRGDIGNTSKMYAKSLFEYYRCDASTIHPYMGNDSILPFLDYKDKLNFILALTSNPGAEDFEKLQLKNGGFLYQIVIEKVKQWNIDKNCGIVFGATNLEDLKNNVSLFNNLPVLLPGIGHQGGSLEDVSAVFKSINKYDFLINASRSIIYKSKEKDFDIAAAGELKKYNDIIKKILKG